MFRLKQLFKQEQGHEKKTVQDKVKKMKNIVYVQFMKRVCKLNDVNVEC